MKPISLIPATTVIIAAALTISCAKESVVSELDATLPATQQVVSVDPSYFIPEALIGEIVKEERQLSDGSTAMCYVIQTYSKPHEHEMGPWAPQSITDNKDAGGIWLEGGKVYDYHAATGQTKEIAQADGHAAMIGYVLDGFGLYAYLDPKGNPPVDLDECGGHSDKTRGYHYHVGAPGSNQIISAFRGIPGTVSTKD